MNAAKQKRIESARELVIRSALELEERVKWGRSEDKQLAKLIRAVGRLRAASAGCDECKRDADFLYRENGKVVAKICRRHRAAFEEQMSSCNRGL